MDKKEHALNLQEITTVQAKELPLSKRIAVFPIASNEQHGTHLPLGTDTFIVQSVVDEVVKRLTQDDPFIFLPSVPYGKSPEHMLFEGTISFKAATVIAILNDIVDSLHQHGVKKVVFINSHGGNSSLLEALSFDFRHTYNVSIYCLNICGADFIGEQEIKQIIPEVEYPEVHAASVETSLLLYLKPDLVGDIPKEFDPKEPFPTIFTGWATQDISYDGVIGDPRRASKERGKQLFEVLVNKTISKLNEIAKSPTLSS